MKKRTFISLSMVALTTLSFAQKKEVKALEKAVKSGQFSVAKSAVASAEALLSQMDEKYKNRFYLAKAQAFLGVDNSSTEDLIIAGDTYQSLVDGKLGAEAKQGLQQVVGNLVNGAVANQNKKEYSSSGKQLEAAYKFSKKDTSYLYYAANNYINAKDYKMSLKLYEQLRDMGYSGIETQYVATNVETGDTDVFNTTKERDLNVKLGTHIEPTLKKTPSKVGEIAKQIALIHLTLGDNENALKAMQDARAKNPDDIYLMRSEADIYLKMGDMGRYQKVISEVLEKDPTNSELYYNLGVSAAGQGNFADAEKFYKKAVEIDPNYASAYNNLAVLKLGEEKAIIEKMNSLGTSRADYAKYDELKIKRENVYRDAAPFLEKALAIRKANSKANPAALLSIAQTLYGIYQYLGDDSKGDVVKALVDKLEAGQ